MKKRKRWVILAVFVIAVAAVAAGAVWWFGRDDSASVHYLTSEVTRGTISQTVQADFALSSANGTTSVALGGGAASDSSSDSSADAQATSSLPTGTAVVVMDGAAESAVSTAYAALTTAAPADGEVSRASDASGSPSPSPSPSSSPSPSPTSTSTPKPTPTPTSTGFPSPSPSASPTGGSVLSGGSGAPSGGSSGSSAGSTSTTATDSTSTSTVSGVVSRLSLPAGAEPTTLRRLLYVSGKPVFAFVSPTPLWKNLSTSLSTGSQRVNVAVLQKALKKQGYYKKAINGNFTSATKKAFMRWQKANGMSKTGVVDVTRFVWMPTGSVLTAWSVNLGSHVSSGTALASVVSPSRLSAEAQISQADIADLKVGQEAQMTIDGYDDTFTGRISFISSEPASSSSDSGSSTSTQYSITVSPEDLPKLAKSGMTGTLDIVIQQVSDVLVVPTTAVSGSSTTSFVRVMQDGKPVYRQVQTGMATASSTEITSGLAEGETVVTGQYTDGADSTGSNSTQGNGGGFPDGGGGFPGGGGGFPSGGFPGGGAPPSGGGQ